MTHNILQFCNNKIAFIFFFMVFSVFLTRFYAFKHQNVEKKQEKTTIHSSLQENSSVFSSNIPE